MSPLFSLALTLLLTANSGIAATETAMAGYDAQLAVPNDPSAYYAKMSEAKRAQEAGKFADAERLYQGLTQDYALERETWVGLATALRQQSKHPAAIDAYARAIALIGPVPGSSRYWTAVSQAALGDSEAALDTLETMVFQDAELDRPGLFADPSFASLQKLPRMRTITGHEDLSKLDRVAGWRADLAHLCAEIKRLSPAYRQRALPAETERL